MPNYNFRQIEKDLIDLREGRQPARHNPVVGIMTEQVDTKSPIGKAMFVIISAIAQLERDLISERVKNGLANARAKGKLIGRKKLRDSDMIRKLLKKGLSYRAIAELCACSHGSVHQEKLAMKKDEALAEKQRQDELAKLAEIEKQNPSAFVNAQNTEASAMPSSIPA